MTQADGVVAAHSDDEQRWLAREKRLIEWLDARIKFYSFWSEFNRQGQRLTSLVILICAVLAPVAVTSKAGAALGVFGFQETAIGRIALIVTILIALEPIREVWIHDEAFAASRLSMMRIMARRMNAATVIA